MAITVGIVLLSDQIWVEYLIPKFTDIFAAVYKKYPHLHQIIDFCNFSNR